MSQLFSEASTLVNGSELKPDTKDKILLIDADTIVYATCSVCEYPTNEEETEYGIDLESALLMASNTVQELLELTGCAEAELHFTSGKNFRYSIKADYKMNRVDTRYPVGLREVKSMMLEQFKGLINSDFEADDMVCMLKREYPEKYIVCAVDKDVLNGVAGTHFNYYKNEKFSIKRKWVVTDELTAIKWPYLQCLMGDSADGIGGVPKIGPKKAEKILDGLTTEAELWLAVAKAYTDAGLTETEAIQTMRLVHMHQLTKEGELRLWTQSL